MRREKVIEYLNKWNTDELFFRDYYEAVSNQKPTAAILKRSGVRESDKRFVLDPDYRETSMYEDRFFTGDRNVVLIKHPRYIPFFIHKHFFFEIIYVFSGQAEEITNDRDARLKEGDFCLISPGVMHGIKVFDDSIVINILIRRSTFMDTFMNLIKDKSPLASFFIGGVYKKNQIRYLLYKTRNDETLRNCVLDMYSEQLEADEYSDRIICGLFAVFCAKLIRKYGDDVIIPGQSGGKTDYGDRMLNYIVSNYDFVTLESLAEHFNFSAPYCSKIIKQYFGTSFSDLVTQIRLRQGEDMLLRTRMSVADISDKIGYKNPETFIRAFQRAYGMSPSRYRKSEHVI